MKKNIDKQQKTEFENEVYRFLDIHAETEQYADKDLEELFSDEKMQDILKTTTECKQALVAEEEADNVDVNTEWETFKQTRLTQQTKETPAHLKGKSSSHFAYKIAASIASIVMLSGVVLAAIHWNTHRHDSQQKAEIVDSTKNNSSSHALAISTKENQVKGDSTTCATPSIKSFDNVELGEILTEMGKYYNKQVVNRGGSAHLRLRFEWNPSLPLEENIKILNSFEHIHVVLESESIIIE